MEDYIILCDIDGVLANCSHRLIYAKNREYDKFYSRENMMYDYPNIPGICLLESLQRHEGCFKTYLVTGRNEDTRATTEEWLDKAKINYDFLRMRTAGDYRPSPTIKKELIAKILKENDMYEVMYYFIDDDPSNVKRVESLSPLRMIGITMGTELFYKMEEALGPDERSDLRHVLKLVKDCVPPIERMLEKGAPDGKVYGIQD